VYAFWAGPTAGVTPPVVRRLQAALADGLDEVASIAAAHADGTPGRIPVYEEYLRRRIVYRLGEPELAGLREFYRRAHALGLVPTIPELRFHADH
jgi:predicted solute-binding protein